MSIDATESRRHFIKSAAVIAVSATFFNRDAAAASDGAGDGKLTAVTFIHGIPGKEADLEAHLLSLAGPTRAEPACIAYDLYRSPSAPHEFMRFEVWESAEALEIHKKMPYLQASFEKRKREGWTTEIIPWIRVPE